MGLQGPAAMLFPFSPGSVKQCTRARVHCSGHGVGRGTDLSIQTRTRYMRWIQIQPSIFHAPTRALSGYLPLVHPYHANLPTFDAAEKEAGEQTSAHLVRFPSPPLLIQNPTTHTRQHLLSPATAIWQGKTPTPSPRVRPNMFVCLVSPRPCRTTETPPLRKEPVVSASKPQRSIQPHGSDGNQAPQAVMLPYPPSSSFLSMYLIRPNPTCVGLTKVKADGKT
ncbi:hypothetical protein B0T14DRAFT_264860 [Immersiella caudata]|uniref:Uncharacterized protein n=1 Tax=Immersiella caudata TaxID=314043 RepID=A0AA39WL13_9PEZI|nr:hypothetical protein B0T14DRAFT_264860 [Immersiella caudata]